VFLDCQSFSSQGTLLIRDTLILQKYLVSRAVKGGRGNVFRSRHTLNGQFSCVVAAFWLRVCVFCSRHTLLAGKPVSRAGNRGNTCNFVRDTLFWLKYLVSRAKKWCSGYISVNDTPFFAEAVCVACMERGISGKICPQYTLFFQIGCVAGYDTCSEGYNVCSYDYGVCCGSCNVCCGCPVARKLLRRNLHYGYPP
jgi:hypothetical protein